MAKIVKSLSLDVSLQNRIQAVLAKQYDKDSRFLKIRMTNEGEPVTIEQTSIVTINALRADNTSKAFSGEVNEDGTVTVPMTYWMLELDDKVSCDISVTDAQGRKLSTLNFTIEVEHANYAGDDISTDDKYDVLTQLIAEVSELKAQQSSWTPAQIDLLETVLSHLAYDDASTGQTAADSLIASLRGGIASKTLTSISATYSGGTVAAGTTLDQLTGITVTATYSDGSTATVASGDYTLSGTLTAGQDNTVTVTYQGKTATFTVTVEEESSTVTGESTTATCAGSDSSSATYIPYSGKTLTFADAMTLQPTKIVITTNPEDRKTANLNVVSATIVYADGSWSLTEGNYSNGSSADGGNDMTKWTPTINITFITDSDGKYTGIERLDMVGGSSIFRWRSAYYQFAIYSGDQAV